MSFFQTIIFAIIQGISELFPISSIAHGVITPFVDTAVALLISFRKEWIKFISSFFKQGYKNARKTLVLIVIATIPAALIGLALEKPLRHINNVQIVNFVTPEMYQAKGDGTTDDTNAFLNMYADAKTKNVNVRLTKKRYKITAGLDTTGVSTYSENHSVLDFQIAANEGYAFSWGGDNVEIRGVVFELSNSTTATAMQGLYNSAANANNQRFIDNKLIGKTFSSPGVGNIYGVWVNAAGLKNLYIKDNVFENVNYAIQINQQATSGGNIATPLGNPIENVFIENNTILKSNIGINTPHVYCRYVFIKNNRVTSDNGFNINIAHTNNFVIEGNILDGATVTTDSVIHIEDVSYAGIVSKNIIRSQSTADGIRILLASGVSLDTYVPTESIIVSENDIKGVGTTYTNAIQVVDASSTRIMIENNRFESYNFGVSMNSLQSEIINNRYKNLTVCLHLSQPARVQGMTVESCTNILSTNSTMMVEVDNLMFVNELPNLKPLAPTNVSKIFNVIYKNIKIQSPTFTISSNVAFKLLTLPDTGKFDANFYYRAGVNLDQCVIKGNIKYDGTTFTATKLFEVTGGIITTATFTMATGDLNVAHYVGGAGTDPFTTFVLDIDSILYSSSS